MSVTDWEKRFVAGELRGLTRLISLAENGEDTVVPVLSRLYSKIGRAKVIGMTGAPGAGKSTLVGAFLRHQRKLGRRVAVLAIDPMSPFTGGSLLGDRIRLAEHFNDDGVFIRSLSTRGRLGGLSPATWQAVHLCDAFGFDYVVIETVGVGQNEVDVRLVADLAAVVVVPEGGDGVQTLKAGVLEIGDWFVVNKADREGADRMEQELCTMLEFAGRPRESVTCTNHKDEASYGTLFSAWDKEFEKEKSRIEQRREKGRQALLQGLLTARVAEAAGQWVKEQEQAGSNPYASFEDFLKSGRLGTLFPRG